MSQPVFFLLVGLVSVPVVTLALCGFYALVVVGIRHYKRRHTGRVGEEDGDGNGDGDEDGNGNGEGRSARGGSRGGGGGPPPRLPGNLTAAWLEAQIQQAEFSEADEYGQGAGGGGRKQDRATRTQTQGPPGPGPGPGPPKGAPPRNQRALAGATAAATPTARRRADISAPPPVQWRSGAGAGVGVADSGVVSCDGASSVQGDEPPMSLADRLHMRRSLLQGAPPAQRATARAAAAPDPRSAHQSHEHEIEPSAEQPVSAIVGAPRRPPAPLDGRQIVGPVERLEMKQVPPRRSALPADIDYDYEVTAGNGGGTIAPAANSGAQAPSSTSADADCPKPKSRKKKSSREEKGQWAAAAGDRNEGHERPEEEPRAGRRRSDASPAATGARANQSNANGSANGRARRVGADLEAGAQGTLTLPQTQTQPALQQLPLQMQPLADRYVRQQQESAPKQEAGRLPPIAASSASGANANTAASVKPTGPIPGALWRASAEQTANAQGNGYDRKSAATGRRAAMYNNELPAKETSQLEDDDDDDEEGEPSRAARLARAARSERVRTQRNDRREHSLADTMQAEAASGQWRRQQQRVVDEVRTSVGGSGSSAGREEAERARDRRRSSSGSDAREREREPRNSRSSRGRVRGPMSYPEEDEQQEQRQRELESQGSPSPTRTSPRALLFARMRGRGQSTREREREPAAQASRQGRAHTPPPSPPPVSPTPQLEAARSSRPFAQFSTRQQNSRPF